MDDERLVRVPGPFDLRGTLRSLAKSGMGWPMAMRADEETFKATSTPDGPATLAFRPDPEGARVRAWGPGAGWALDQAPRWLGVDDDPAAFVPHHPVIAEQHRRDPGVRLGRTGRVLDALIYVVLGQVVTEEAARSSRRALWTRYGEPAPGPVDLRLAPSPEALKGLAYFHLHELNVERKRADILLHAARVAGRLEECVRLPLPDARARLLAVRGVGPWTAAHVGAVALGDPDAVPVGDYHLKNAVSWALAGEPRGTDERMVELLAPYAGQRRRALHYLGRAGITAPKYGPKLASHDITGR